MKALNIINDWINYATKHKMNPHSKYFWNARDIIEKNGIILSEEKVNKTIEFIKSLDDSDAKTIIIKALEGK